jgi:glycosyltransferase involved in cell wall biosynthesis
MARNILKGQLEQAATHPDPFTELEEFTDWLVTPAWGMARLTPAQWSAWSDRPDARALFPDPFGDDGPAFLEWCEADPGVREWLAEVASAAGRTSPFRSAPRSRPTRPFGWSVLAYATAELGLGETGRRTADIVAQAGVPMELVGTRLGTSSRLGHLNLRHVESELGYDNVITAINADLIRHVGKRFGLDQRRGFHAGLWFWELEQFPEPFAQSAEIVDEVWTASAFTQRAIEAAIDKPVRLIRYAIEVPTRPTAYTRRSLGMPENKFIFMTSFDYFSIYERKNPMGTIQAYLNAFGPDDGATLVVKSINGHHRVSEREHVRMTAAGRPDVLFLDDYVTRGEVRGMIELSDCVVSLHRAEGYGLNLADAYGLGTPTIATGYSGNLEFMTPDTGLLVPFGFVDVGPDSYPYPANAFWADPDLDAAAAAMRLLFDDREFAHSMAARAREYAVAEHSWSAAVGSVRALLREGAQLA